MDYNFKLNDAQYNAVMQFKNACNEMQRTGVAIILDRRDWSFKFCNGNDIEFFVDEEEVAEYPEAIDISDEIGHEELECIIDTDIQPNSVYGPHIWCVTKPAISLD